MLHPGEGKGPLVRVEGVADNGQLQLQLLLADALADALAGGPDAHL